MTRREELGKLVRDTWVKWAATQADPKDTWMVPWEELDAGQREVDMLIGEAVAAASHRVWLEHVLGYKIGRRIYHPDDVTIVLRGDQP